MRKLSEAQATRCEHATQPRCQCRCQGALHGAARGDVLDLPSDDVHRPAWPTQHRSPRLFSEEEMAAMMAAAQEAGYL